MEMVADGGRGEGVAVAVVEGDDPPDARQFYGRQSRITDPGPHVARLDHLPRDAFLVAGEAWRRCRVGEAGPESFGLAPDSLVRGWRYLQSQLVRDAASLNKVELLCWDLWGLAHATEETAGPEDLALLDHLATLTLSDDSRFGELRRLYESESRLRVPPVVTSLSAAGGWRTPQEVSLWTA